MRLPAFLRRLLLAGLVFATPALAAVPTPLPPIAPIVRCYVDRTLGTIATCIDAHGKKVLIA